MNSVLILTPAGQQRAENTHGKGADYAVLSYMYEIGGPVEFVELVDHLKTDEVKASMIVHRLINEGSVRET